MQIRWKLRIAAAQREVWTGSQLRRLLAERAGLEMSSASVSALFTRQPSQLKLTTLLRCAPPCSAPPTTCSTSTPPRLNGPRRQLPASARRRRARGRTGPVDAADLRRRSR